MLVHSFSIFPLLTLVLAQAKNYSQPGIALPCKDVHIFLARGNNEPYPGRQGKLVTAICNGLSSCDYEDIQFYNPYEASYAASVQEGATNGVIQVTAYAESCPKSSIVLSGYSQGSNVIGDVLGGGYGVFFHNYTEAPVKGITSDTGKHIKAVLVFGDTRHTAGQSYNVESGASGTGLFPRPADLLATLNQYASIMRSYCVATDPICAADLTGPNPSVDDVKTHLNYFEVFTDDAASWVQKMVGGSASNSTTITSATGTSTSTSVMSSTSAGSTKSSTVPATTTSQAPSPTASRSSNYATALRPCTFLCLALVLLAKAIFRFL